MISNTLRKSFINTKALRFASQDPLGSVARNYESTRSGDQRRHEDEPEPTEDDQIKSHYLKHHPMYEFRNFDELHVDGYRHWLHGRADYFQSETYPGQISAWEMGKKSNHLIYLFFPVFAFKFFGDQYRKHLKQKNIRQDIVGVFSQHSA